MLLREAALRVDWEPQDQHLVSSASLFAQEGPPATTLLIGFFQCLHFSEEPTILFGDALRLIALAERNHPTPKVRSAVQHLRAICQSGVSFAPLKSLSFRTPHGLQSVSPRQLSRIHWMSERLPNCLQLPVVSCPLFDVLVPLSTHASLHDLKETSTSWTLSVPAVELAALANKLDMPLRQPHEDPPPPAAEVGVATADAEVGVVSVDADILREFLTKAVPEGEKNLAGEVAVDMLVMLVPRKLSEACEVFGCVEPFSIASLGLINLLFKQLFSHLFVNRTRIAAADSVQRLARCLDPTGTLGAIEGDYVSGGDLFAHLFAVHAKTGECLRALRTAYPQLVSAGACLTALHTINSGGAVSAVDTGRSRLFDSAEEARGVVSRIFKEDLYQKVVELYEATDAAYAFCNEVVLRDLYMFRRLEKCKTRNYADYLFRNARTTMNLVEQKAFGDPGKKGRKVKLLRAVEPMLVCKAQLAILSPPALLTIIDRVTRQLKAFRHGLLLTRQELSGSWWMAFSDSLIDSAASENLQVFVSGMQSRLDLIETWARSLHFSDLREFPARMWKLLARQADDSSGLDDAQLANDILPVVEDLTVPFGSKNSPEPIQFTEFFPFYPLPSCQLPSPELVALAPESVPNSTEVVGCLESSDSCPSVVSSDKQGPVLTNPAAKRVAIVVESGVSSESNGSSYPPPYVQTDFKPLPFSALRRPPKPRLNLSDSNSVKPPPSHQADPSPKVTKAFERERRIRRRIQVGPCPDIRNFVCSQPASKKITISVDKGQFPESSNDEDAADSTVVRGRQQRRSIGKGVDRRTLGRLMRSRKIQCTMRHRKKTVDRGAPSRVVLRTLRALRRRAEKRRLYLLNRVSQQSYTLYSHRHCL